MRISGQSILAGIIPGRLAPDGKDPVVAGEVAGFVQRRAHPALGDRVVAAVGHVLLAGPDLIPGRLAPDGKDPVVFQGLNPGGAEAAIGYTIPNLRPARVEPLEHHRVLAVRRQPPRDDPGQDRLAGIAG
jgi:hypothetical protein